MASRAVGPTVANQRRRLPRLTRLRDWRVPTKVTAVLVIPALAFLVVVGWQASLLFGQAASLASFADRAALADPVTALVHELQFERDLTTGHLAAAAGRDDVDARWPEPVLAARHAVDDALDAYRQAAAPLHARHPDDPALARAAAALAELAVVRAGADEGWLVRQAVFDGYSRAIEALLALLPAPLAGYDEAVGGYLELAEAKEAASRIRGQVYAVLSAGRFGPGEQELFAAARAQRRVAEQRFRADATPVQLAVYGEVVRGQAVHATARLEQAVLSQAGGDFDVTAPQWWSAATTQLEQVREVETRLLAEIRTEIRRGSGASWRQATAVTVTALLVLLLSLGLSLAIGRSMVRSLRLLRRQAVDVAQTDLPSLLTRLRTTHHTVPRVDVVPTSTGGRDEIAEVADAFTMVHRSAVDLAVEQAQMRRNVHRIFVNLARRSQLLVERQLELLDDLERDESDPTRLANLFRLDHLATRMRRNNDSLLVLTDTDPGHRYHEPVPLSSVVLAAIAEIERYQRVRETVTTGLGVVGHVVADLVHLLAELLDNATTFSAKDSDVDLEVSRLPTGGVVIDITDRGMGMSADALREANTVLAAPPPIDVATSERMGLVVVGHLAARHRLTVRLSAARPGVRATVWLPPRVLAPIGEEPPITVPTPAPDPGERPRQVALRAEDVLRQGRSATGGAWWSRPPGRRGSDGPAGPAGGDPGAVPPRRETSATPATGEAPATRVVQVATATSATGTAASRGGLPVRVPMAQLPSTSIGASLEPPPPPPDPEPDPDEVGATLTAFYRGVRRAESEEASAPAAAGAADHARPPSRHPAGRTGQE